MDRLFLCEKPSQARDIARILGASTDGPGCLVGNGVTVTWCFGHLFELAYPESYDPGLKVWSLESLPIIPDSWRMELKAKASKQFTHIKRLLGKATEVVIATDADREGELIAREVLAHCNWRGPTKRLWLSALDPASVRKALSNIMPGEKTEPLYRAGLARLQADWLMGMNLTRLYTILGRMQGGNGVLSVGRVQTPTLRLVVDRDRAIENFKPKTYWTVSGTFEVPAGRFQAKWMPPEAVVDQEGHCVKEDLARAVAKRSRNATGTISRVETERKKEAPPLPFDLNTLQQMADRRYGLEVQKTLDLAQSLYETHKAVSYPRTDSRYLPVSQFLEASDVLAAMRASDPRIGHLIDEADTEIRSRAWNDSKVTAHHAIIPTQAVVDVGAMNRDEFRIYDLIRRQYLAQFFPRHEYDRTVLEVLAGDDRFVASGQMERVAGWKAVLGSSTDDEDETKARLPSVEERQPVEVLSAEVMEKKTSPPPRFTQGSLVSAMKNVAKVVTDEDLRVSVPTVIDVLISRLFDGRTGGWTPAG